MVLAYEQMFYDLLADPEPYLNDINNVATQPQLDLDLRSLQEQSGRREHARDRVDRPSDDRLGRAGRGRPQALTRPPSPSLVCVDTPAATATYEGKPVDGQPRELTQYRVVKTTYLPDPGWAVAKVLPPEGHDQPQPC